MSGEINFNRRTFLTGLGGLITALSIPELASPAEARQDPGAPSSSGRFGDIDENAMFDVCIIGSGFAGGVLGDALVKQGIKTVILESGPDPRGKTVDPRFQQLNAFRSIGPIVYPVTSSRFRGLGGTSWLWGGICTRLHPRDFEKSTYSGGASWPITYKDLQPFYRQAEAALRVRGGGSSKYHPPRSEKYPLPADRDVSPLEAMVAKAGIILSDMPYSTSISSKPSFFSDRFGPRVQMTDSHLPNFQKSSYGSLFSEVTVTRLLADESGLIRGAEVKDLDRNVKILRARVYVVACGGLESPRLLLLSRSSSFPTGIGNNHDLVGRFFTEHRPAVFIGQVTMDWRNFSYYALKGFSYQFYEKFKNAGMGGMRLGFDLEGAVDRADFSTAEVGNILNRILNRRLEITVGSEMKPTFSNRVILDAEARDYFGNSQGNLFLKESEDEIKTLNAAKEIVRKVYADLGAKNVEELPRNVWAHHHMGTCRMGDDARTSVVDRNLQVHGTRNLFVGGSAPFVTSGTAHPTLSLTALSLRLAEYLRLQMQSGGAFPTRYENRREVLQRTRT